MRIGKASLVVGVVLTALVARGADDGYREWLKQRESLLRDSSLVRRYTFADVKTSADIVKDLSGNGGDLRFVPFRDETEAIDDLQVIEGRTLGARAVRLSKGWYQGAPVDVEDNEFTTTCWFRVNPGDGLNRVGTMLSTGGWTRGWRVIGTDPLAVSIGKAGGCAKAMAKAYLPQRLWHHLAAVWDGATIELFLNGTRVASANYTGEYIPAAATDLFKVGFDQDGGMEPLPIDIDEICIFTRPLPKEEIAVLSRREPDPVDSIFQAADRCCAAGDYERARLEYGKLAALATLECGKGLALFNCAESYRLEKAYAGAHRTYQEILALPRLTDSFRTYTLFRQAEVYVEQKDFAASRRTYERILAAPGGAEHSRFMAHLAIGDTYRSERNHGQARRIYETLLKEQETSSYPHDGYRVDLLDRLEAIEGLADGREQTSRQEARAEWVNRPRYSIFVSAHGSDDHDGTEQEPFATIARAREEVRRIKRKRGLPDGGIAVCLRGGNYFIDETIALGKEDSGTTDSPIVYRSYPGEKARIIGGRKLDRCKVADDPAVLARLPEEARGKVWVADLKAAGITEFGQLRNRGAHGTCNPGAMELFHNTRPLRLARWPKQGWLRVADLVDPEGDAKVKGMRYQKGKFRYADARPKRWTEEPDIWTAGYFMRPWNKLHTRVLSIDTVGKIVYLSPDIRWWEGYPLYRMPVCKDTPYFFYNLFSELSAPGEFYIDRNAGRLYFYPPDADGSPDNELIVSTLDAPLLSLDNVSDLVLFGLTLECTWRDAVVMKDCTDTLIAGCTIRNTGNSAAVIEGGWRNGVVGCDIYDTGEGGIAVAGGDWEKLIPGGHVVENNHIHRFNRFSHGSGKFAVRMKGVGHRLSHNLIHDTSYIAIIFDGNNHLIEYNEIYDVMNEGRDGGAIYTYGEPRYLMNRGNVMRYNFLHHITEHSSPLKTHQVTGIYIDAFNAGMVMLGNIFYRHTERAMFTHGPDTRIENNIFVDNNVAITQSNRTYLLRPPDRVERWDNNILKKAKHRQPPWSSAYPQIVNILEDKPIGAPKRIAIQRNVATGGPFLRVSGDFNYEDNVIKDNWEGGRVFFRDLETLDFRIRPGSPVFGTVGHTPVPFAEIGLYRDALRASWPVPRKYGKYYKPDKVGLADRASAKFPPLKRVSKSLEYKVRRRTSTITIDGTPEAQEWGGLDKNSAIIVEQEHLTGQKNEDARSYAWLLYDDEYLYVCVEHLPDLWREGLPKKVRTVVHELAIEVPLNHKTWWWEEGLPTGPLYVFSGRPNGTFTVHNLFNMPQGVIRELENSIQFKSVVIDSDLYHWTAEWRVPLAALNLNPRETKKTRFSIGGTKRVGWFCWVATGGSIWRVDNAGVIEFAGKNE